MKIKKKIAMTRCWSKLLIVIVYFSRKHLFIFFSSGQLVRNVPKSSATVSHIAQCKFLNVRKEEATSQGLKIRI